MRTLLVVLAVAVMFLAGCGQLFQPTTKVEGARVESQRFREKLTGGAGGKESYYRRSFETPVMRPSGLPARPLPPPGPASPNTESPGPVGPPAAWVPAVPAQPPPTARGSEERWEYVAPDQPDWESEYGEGNSQGAGVRGPGASGKMGEAPEVDLGAGTASGGTMNFTTKVLQGALKGPLILIGIGTVLVVGGAVLIFLAKLVWWGMGAIACGLCLIGIGLAVEAYPWVALVAPLVLVVVAIGVIVYLWKTGNLAKAWTQVVTGTDAFIAKIAANPTLTPEAKAAVKTDFAAAQDKAQDVSTQTLVDQTQK